MANPILIKRSSVAAKVPATTDLALGELAINTVDGKLFLKKDVSGTETIVQVGPLSTTELVEGSNLYFTAARAQTAVTTITGNAGTATTLQTARTINGVSFNGSANITVTAAASTLTGATLASGVTASSLTSVGTLASLAVTGAVTGASFNSITGLSAVAGAALGTAATGTATTAARADHVHALQTTVSGNAGTATILQTARTINGVSFNGSANITINAVDATARIAVTEKGAINGVATLDASGLVPSTQLPSYIDDVLEYADLAGFPVTGETAKIYVALDTNKTYRWSGSAYVYITSGAVDSVAGKTGVVTLVKADVGLESVDNTSDAAKPVSTAQQTALNLKANLASPTFTGVPLSTTAAVGTNTTQIATTAFVNAEIAADIVAPLALKANLASPTFTGTVSGITAVMVGAQPLDADLTSIAALAGTAGFLKKTGADTWALDTAAYTTNLGTVTGVTGTAPIVSSGGAAPAISISPATTSAAGSMSAADKTKLDGVATSANNYVHPTGDGNSHVPVTGTTSSGKVLVAGATANSFAWTTLDMTYLPDAPFKKSARVATTANIGSTFAAGVITGPIGVLVIDGITVALNDRILVKDQSAALQNGIYYVSTLGTASVAWVLTRTAGANTASELAGALVNVDSGTQGGYLYDTDFKSTDTLNTTAVTWNRILDTGLASTVVGATPGTAAIGTSLNYARQDHVHPLQTTVSGLAGTATTLATARLINGVSFNGSADITVTAAASTLSGTTLAAGVTASSLTSVGTLTSLAVSGSGSIGGMLTMTQANAGIELGSNTVNTPFIDFHSSANAVDYDARIIANGGNATIGQGSLQLIAAGGVSVSNALTVTGAITVPSITKSGTNGTGDIGQSTNTFGTVYATVFSGVSTTAKYADLAENYAADAMYAPGTVVMFGGEQEVTLGAADTQAVAGVITTNPAHLMNSEIVAEFTAAVALQGRVPCRVIGAVAKGDLMVSAGNGFAKANNDAKIGQVIGKALGSNASGESVIEVVVGRV